ncbi:spore protease YyaC [Virgibacillus necropolis]|uniref:Spore protease YyaC n=1 Tax=Virgibacillus necropolis TaxID=163877 RepID=A0A221M853_9BACI|nr:spore protease YyaC [Virgibacillus necropolis]ASN03805.1 spore protease YyaC [Virgibacillus necropolis]
MNLKRQFVIENERENMRLLYTDSLITNLMSEKIISWLPTIPREYVVVCIGTDRSTGDSLGPLTGTFLHDHKPKHLAVYGTIHDPVHATNLKDYIKLIHNQHRNPYIIAIDACLGKSTSVGNIILGKGPLKPGAALNKPLPQIGDIHLTGVVNISGFMEFSILQNTRLSIVLDMAKQLANLLIMIDNQLKQSIPSPSIVMPPTNQESLEKKTSTKPI